MNGGGSACKNLPELFPLELSALVVQLNLLILIKQPVKVNIQLIGNRSTDCLQCTMLAFVEVQGSHPPIK